MTNLQHHLKTIRKVTLRALSEPVFPEDEAIRQMLRDALPASYGISHGHIVHQTSPEHRSDYLRFIIYDVPLSDGAYTPDSRHFKARDVLLGLDIAQSHTSESFAAIIKKIASFKKLYTSRRREDIPPPNENPSERKQSIPKNRLPFGWMIFDRFGEYDPDDPALFHELYRIMDKYKSYYNVHEHNPDRIDIIGQNALLLNPLLDNNLADRWSVGWLRQPDFRAHEYCYVCKKPYLRRHFFYDQLCPTCGDKSYTKRVLTADLEGYRVLVTGGRVKIGFSTCLRLLRAGAEVIVTSRFPRDTARRFTEESDFERWGHRLHVYGLDLCQIPRVEAFAQHLIEKYSHLDAIINNAAQTIKRPPAYYAHLIPFETAPLQQLSSPLQNLLSDGGVDTPSDFSTVLGHQQFFPAGKLDAYGQQIDNRDYNSWVMPLEAVPVLEMIEVHLVNAVAPALLVGRLKPLLEKSPRQPRFVINVSAAEGRFSQFKNGLHPHTNMAKAALNMLTRTIAEEYAKARIWVYSVDPGWVSDQAPRQDDESRAEGEKYVPLDMIDAAARICDPIFSQKHGFGSPTGVLLKDYHIVGW